MIEALLIGNNPSINKIRELVTMVSDTAFNVLLTGETGTGKEVVARLLHKDSPRQQERFVKVNCAALPLTLLESELFGYEKGAFTGAAKMKPGKFELASKGVIFLDEIGDMPMLLQAKLLHVLQSSEFNRLGGTQDIKVNAWVIASTNHDLEEDMEQGLFREDLYYRLNIIKIDIPPLRERIEDIPLLVDHFVQKHRKELNTEDHFSLNEDLEDIFQTYHWPGNVRELSSTLLRLMVGDDPERVKSELVRSMEADGVPVPVGLASGIHDEAMGLDQEGPEAQTVQSLKKLKSDASQYIERKAIKHALERTGWNKRQAAKMLKISYKALFYKMADLGIERENSIFNKNNNKKKNTVAGT
jgi:transcriptional regulator with PAS, ATPase and Fis domain